MPTISTFLGIAIRMYYNEHAPPHFHIYYNEYLAEIRIDTFEIIAGNLPKRVLSLVIEWAIEHRTELFDNWHKSEQHLPFNSIAPLE